MKKHFLRIIVVFAILFFCTIANAMNGAEFMRLPSASEQKKVIEPIMLEYVSMGYRNVPDWSGLIIAVENAIRKNGWGNRGLADIALDAAKAKGMTK